MSGTVQPSDDGQEIVVLYCQGCVAEKPSGKSALREMEGLRIRLVALPCTSKVEIPHVLRILEKGVDGVQVIGCPEPACRFLVGSRLAEKRIQRARDLLEIVGMGAERVGLERGAGLDVEDLVGAAQRRAAAARELGPNPMKEREQ